MSLMDWLCPVAADARRKALARMEATKRYYDAIDKAEEPIRRICREVIPLLQEAELQGIRPEYLALTKEDVDALALAAATSDTLRGEQRRACRDITICGVRVVEGTERRVIGKAD